MRRLLPLWILLVCSLSTLPATGDEQRPAYPDTPAGDEVVSLHGEILPDPYRWLEPDDDAQVEAWDRAQYDLLRAYVDAYPRRAELKKRIDAEFALGGMRSLPTFEGGWRWTTYRPQGADHAILYRQPEDGSGEAAVVLDPNTWSADKTASMKSWDVSPNGRYIAYRRDMKGSEDTTLFVWDVEAKQDLPDAITRTKFSSILWDLDSTGFFYSRMPDPESVPADEAQYHRRLRHHRLGALVIDDPVVCGQGRPMLESSWLYRSSDDHQLFVARGLPYESVDVFEARFDGTHLDLDPINVGHDERTWVDKVGDTYIFDTDRNTGLREVFTARRDAMGAMGPWQLVDFPRSDKGVVKDIAVVGGRYLLGHLKDDLVSHLYVRRIDGGPVREIPLPGPGTVGSNITTKDGDARIWFSFQSYARPVTTYRCDIAAETPTLVVEETLPTTVDPDGLVSVQTTYASQDGTQVPIFLLHKKGMKLDGSQPTILNGYGGFRVGLYPNYSRTRALWAEMGGVFAVACLRGGDEFGEDWHQAGCLAHKQNVFDDFIAAADWLVSTGRASREKLAIQGGSNGGLLVAVCVNQRPDLCRAAICGVPLTDMLRYHHFQYAKSWTKEYGDPDVEEHFHWIRPYSPYHNVQIATAYPAVLVTAGLEDGRVNAFHARKMAAQWQAATISNAPILLRIDRLGGHGAAGLSRALEEVLDEWSFLLRQMGS